MQTDLASPLRRAYQVLQAQPSGLLTSGDKLTYITLAALTEIHRDTNRDGLFLQQTIAELSQQPVGIVRRSLERLISMKHVRRVPGATIMYMLRWGEEDRSPFATR